MQDHDAVRTVVVSQRPKPLPVVGKMRARCSISAIGDNGVSSGECTDDVSGAIERECESRGCL